MLVFHTPPNAILSAVFLCAKLVAQNPFLNVDINPISLENGRISLKIPNSGIARAYKNAVVRATSGVWNHSFSLPSEDSNLFFLEQFLCQRSDSVSPLSNITVIVN